MKKAFLGSLITGIVTLGLGAGAMAVSANVLTVTAEQTGATVSFSGTTDAGVLAVTCELLDEDNNEKAINSVAVEDAKFGGSFTLGENDDVNTIRCANYSGGEIVTSEIMVVIDDESEVVPKAPDTGIAR